MSINTEDTSADTFWPGYVDAVTNLVLNLLFVVLIMTVAVFVLALEMGKQQIAIPTETVSAPSPTVSPAAAQEAETAPTPLSGQDRTLTAAKESEVRELKKKIFQMEEELRREAAARRVLQAQPTGPVRDVQPSPASDSAGGKPQQTDVTLPASSTVRIPERVLDKVAPTGTGGAVLVKFADDAISLTRVETEELKKALAPIVASGGAKIEVVVPKGFSEAKRLAFYRAMSVRNHLIEMKLAAASIDVSVREGSNSADSSRVLVSPR